MNSNLLIMVATKNLFGSNLVSPPNAFILFCVYNLTVHSYVGGMTSCVFSYGCGV